MIQKEQYFTLWQLLENIVERLVDSYNGPRQLHLPRIDLYSS